MYVLYGRMYMYRVRTRTCIVYNAFLCHMNVLNIIIYFFKAHNYDIRAAIKFL